VQPPVNQPDPLMRLADRNRDDKIRMIERTVEHGRAKAGNEALANSR
jgi:hypothetical protein